MVAEDIDVKYEDAIKRCKPSFRSKLEHSVSLLRKAEGLAKMYDNDDGFFLAFSGGKDSQALYHVTKMAGVLFKGHFSPTSVDPPDLIRFIKNEYPSVEWGHLDFSIYQRAVERRILPTMRVRWCCADFKETAGAGKVTLIGIRKEESARRAKRHEVEVSNKKFSGSLDEFEDWSKAEIERKTKRKSKRKINEDEFSVKSDSEVHCINGKDSILISPIFDWTEKDIWYFLDKIIGAPHCNLYDEGYKRIGCILCPMSSLKSKQRDIERFPHVKRNWIKAIKEIRSGGGYSKKDLYGGTSQQNGCSRHYHEKRDSERKQQNIWTSGRIQKAIPIGRTFGHRFTREQFNDASRWKPTTPTHSKTTMGQQTHNTSLRQERCSGFSESPASGGVDAGQWTEDEIAEAIFDWWISGKPYKQWYSDKYLQQEIEFDTE